MQGTVKWFDETKGYGFILPDDEVTGLERGRDLFVHANEVTPPYEGARSFLEEGERVEFELAANRKGPKAVNVKLVRG